MDVTLLDRAACHVFQPLLYQCATGTLSVGQISRSLREELARHRNVTTLLGDAIELDADARRVTARRPDGSTFTVDYDVLVVAVGMQQSYFGHEEYAQWAPGMKTLDDALSIRRRLFGAFEIAETLPPGPERDAWLTFVVAGGGPTGVELAGQIREMATRTLANEFHSIAPEEARVLLFDGGDRLVKSFAPNLAGKAAKVLEELGVELHMGVHVTDVRQRGRDHLAEGGRPGRGVRGADGAVDRRCRGGAVRAPRRRGAGGDVGSLGPDRGGGRPDRARASGDLRHRRPRRPRRPTGSGRERHAGRPARRRMRPPRPRRQAPEALPLPRPGLGGVHQPRARPAAGRTRSGSPGFPAGWAGVSSTSRSSPACRTASAPWQRGSAPSPARTAPTERICSAPLRTAEQPYTWSACDLAAAARASADQTSDATPGIPSAGS